MPNIRSLDFSRLHKAYNQYDTYKAERDHAKLDRVWDAITFFMTRGVRNPTYKELSEQSGEPVHTVRYYMDRFKFYGAIKGGK